MFKHSQNVAKSHEYWWITKQRWNNHSDTLFNLGKCNHLVNSVLYGKRYWPQCLTWGTLLVTSLHIATSIIHFLINLYIFHILLEAISGSCFPEYDQRINVGLLISPHAMVSGIRNWQKCRTRMITPCYRTCVIKQ